MVFSTAVMSRMEFIGGGGWEAEGGLYYPQAAAMCSQ